MIQSLVPAIYPILKDPSTSSFMQVGLITLVLPMHRLAAAAAGRAVHRPAADALLARRRHGLHPRRAAAAVGRRQLRLPAAGGGADRHGLLGVPPGSLARRAHGVGRALRLRAIVLSGRRQRRLGDRAAARRLHRAAGRPVAASRGSPPWRCWRCSCCSTSATGTAAQVSAVAHAGARRRAPRAGTAARARRGHHRRAARCCCSPSISTWRA